MTRARDFFDAVRDAAVDAEMCRRQLMALEARVRSLGGMATSPPVSSTHDPDRMAGRVAAYVDREEQLRSRMDADYALVDRACVVLYGPDQRTGGLADDRSATWASVLWWRYCAAETWLAVGDAVGYTERQCRNVCAEALRWIDRTGYAADVMELPEG